MVDLTREDVEYSEAKPSEKHVLHKYIVPTDAFKKAKQNHLRSSSEKCKKLTD